MKKCDLRSDRKVITRNGEEFIVMLNPSTCDWDLIGVKGGYLSLKYYTEGLLYKGTEMMDIVRIESPTIYQMSLLFEDYNKIKWEVIWEREESIKEVTIKEIQDRFGCKVKIVEEEKGDIENDEE